jgi:hypothetical protein
MNLAAWLVVLCVVLAAACLAAVASLAMAQVEEELRSFNGFGGMQFEG